MRAEQTVAYSISPVVPTTAGRLPVFATTGNPSKATDSAFAQGDNGRQIIVGLGAFVNAGQVSPNPIVIIGDGASGWGIGAVALGRNVTAGVNAARDGCIVIGYGTTSDAKNGIRIGSALAVGGAFDDTIAIGTQASSVRPGVCIGKLASQAGPDGIAIGTSSQAAEGSSIAIGRGAACTNSGLGTPNTNIAIGDGAVCSPSFAGAEIAIGSSARSSGQFCCVIGAGAQITNVNTLHSIAIGHGAGTARSNECVIGDSTTGPITLFTVRPGAAAPVLHRVGGSGGWGVRDAADANTIFLVDSSAGAGDIRLWVWDVTFGGLKRVTMAAAGAAPAAGFRALQVPV